MMIVKCSSCSKPNRVPAARAGDKARCAACKAPILPLSRTVSVSSAGDFAELMTNTTLPVLVDFWAAWCGPCRVVAPELEKLASSQSGRLIVAKLDTEALPAVASRFQISSIPTMILFRSGEEVTRLSGARSAGDIATQLAI